MCPKKLNGLVVTSCARCAVRIWRRISRFWLVDFIFAGKCLIVISWWRVVVEGVDDDCPSDSIQYIVEHTTPCTLLSECKASILNLYVGGTTQTFHFPTSKCRIFRGNFHNVITRNGFQLPESDVSSCFAHCAHSKNQKSVQYGLYYTSFGHTDLRQIFIFCVNY